LLYTEIVIKKVGTFSGRGVIIVRTRGLTCL